MSRLASQCIGGAVEEGASIIRPVPIGFGSIVWAGAVVRGPRLLQTISPSGAPPSSERWCILAPMRGLARRLCQAVPHNEPRKGRIERRCFEFACRSACHIGAHALLGVAPVASKSGVGQMPDLAAMGAKSHLGAGVIVERGALIGEHAIIDNGVVVMSGLIEQSSVVRCS
jgi:hypothetical protein